MLTFTTIDATARIYSAEASIVISKRPRALVFRIDGRGDTYRVDCAKPLMFGAWEAIDGGDGFKRLADAKAHVRKWLRAAREQQDLTPWI